METPSGSTNGRTGKERRRHRRYHMTMRITAVRQADGNDPVNRSQVLGLDVRNISTGGLCGFVAEEVVCNEDLTLCIPAMGGRGGRDVRGRVTRCLRAEGGYMLGLAFRDPSEEASRHLH